LKVAEAGKPEKRSAFRQTPNNRFMRSIIMIIVLIACLVVLVS
ncbi:MAG: hypothetical protein ACJA0I_001960, partial [Gammaproteobacteria bacterium]